MGRILRTRRRGQGRGGKNGEADAITRLNTQDGAALYLTETPDGGYQLVPYDPDFQAKMQKAEEIMRRYPDTLHVLAQ